MPPTKLRLKLDIDRRLFRMTQYPITVLDPLDMFENFVEQAIKDRRTIDSDPHLTAEGKIARP